MEDDRENQSLTIKKANHSSATPASGDGKLRVALKFSKVEGREDDQVGSSGKDQTRICPECHKGFSSGKALGGHMRIHGHENKDLSLKKLKPHQTTKFKIQSQHQVIDLMKKKSNNTSYACLGGNSKPTCVLCSKNFPSMKSLFGHMRCHPEREWRGIQPPPAVKNSSSSSVLDVETQKIDDQVDSAGINGTSVVDLTVSLRRWPVTAKRGRKSKALALTSTWALSSSEDEDEKCRDAANDLIMLAHGDSLESGLTHKQRVEDFEATNSNSAEIEDANRASEVEESPFENGGDYPMKKLRIEERGSKYVGNNSGLSMNMDKEGKGKAMLETVCVAEKPEDRPEGFDHKKCSYDDCKYHESSNGQTVTIKNKKRRKTMKLMDLEAIQDLSPFNLKADVSTIIMPGQYRCSTCEKCFPSHQALGGHRSSHNKFRIHIQNTIDESSSAAAEVENSIYPITLLDEIKENEGASSTMMVESTHQCQICNKTFPTGQALGGHKRCHWTGPAEAPSSQVTSPGEESQTGRKVQTFDLNELPLMEDEGGFESEHATGYGYFSSSYNSVAIVS
ncbi:unnamed protein product [Ilex paraguariensis]|uniref:C2H2-type domain-containing protein n=1 Tax=Ilex paraguariensis TaxID=185542 RepID=A0ABC8SL28_9AQUA